ncbi:MAG: hypothetical protein E7022_00655 [Desulfovibrio desulfuricans]|jgi:hypothetical protein|nr:hypothetical protein [Desulfovibrio desulfuricans]
MATSVTQMSLSTPKVTGTDLAMMDIANKAGRGMQLNTADQLIPTTVGAHKANYAFGNDPAHFTVSKPDMPEMAKGALANYSS